MLLCLFSVFIFRNESQDFPGSGGRVGMESGDKEGVPNSVFVVVVVVVVVVVIIVSLKAPSILFLPCHCDISYTIPPGICCLIAFSFTLEVIINCWRRQRPVPATCTPFCNVVIDASVHRTVSPAAGQSAYQCRTGV